MMTCRAADGLAQPGSCIRGAPRSAGEVDGLLFHEPFGTSVTQRDAALGEEGET
jgi:hypothetical protein